MDKVTQNQQIAGGGALLLLISLFLRYISFNFGFGISGGCSGLSCRPLFGYPLLLLSLGVVVMIGAKVAGANLPALPMKEGDALFYAGAAAAALSIIYLLLDLDAPGIGHWVGIVGAGGMAFGGFQSRGQGEAPGGSMGGGGMAPPPPPPPPPGGMSPPPPVN